MARPIDIRKQKSTTSKAVAANKDRLKAFSNTLDKEFEAELLGPLSFSTSIASPKIENWRNALVGCGSNAFSQLNLDSDIMSTSLKHSPMVLYNTQAAEAAAAGVGVGRDMATFTGGVTGISSLSKWSSSQRKQQGKPSSTSTCSSSTVTKTDKGANDDTNTNKSHKSQIVSISSGSSSHMSGAVIDGIAYIWGEGPGSQSLRTPIPINPTILYNVSHISCGTKHAGLVTSTGGCYTWGSGEYGMLGHDSSTGTSNVRDPRLVEMFSNSNLLVSQVSCGTAHTAFIACLPSEVVHTPIPNGDYDDVLIGGSLYTCGQGKAGQLGLQAKILDKDNSIHVPTRVVSLEDNGFRAVQVSCGFHHMVIIAIPLYSVRTFTTGVFTCGWGEHGRLGLGHDEEVWQPTQVQFPMPFHATTCAAGEQHSIAAGKQGVYCWGSNSMGQLGVGNTLSADFSCLPIKVPIPEGMIVNKLAAGGRHTGAITSCGRVLTWGWGEEGQLGHGTEKNCTYPRPCRVPKIQNKVGTPVLMTMGQCHTTIMLQNSAYTTPLPSPSKPEAVPPPLPTLTLSPVKEYIPVPEPEPVPVPVVEPEPEPQVESPVEKEVAVEVPIVGIRELLRSREAPSPVLEPEPEPEPEQEPEPEVEKEIEIEAKVEVKIIEVELEQPIIEPEEEQHLWDEGGIAVCFYGPPPHTITTSASIPVPVPVPQSDVIYAYTLDGTTPVLPTSVPKPVSEPLAVAVDVSATSVSMPVSMPEFESFSLTSSSSSSSTKYVRHGEPFLVIGSGKLTLQVIAYHPNSTTSASDDSADNGNDNENESIVTYIYTPSVLLRKTYVIDSPPVAVPVVSIPALSTEPDVPKTGIYYGGRDTTGLLIANSAIRAEARKLRKAEKEQEERNKEVAERLQREQETKRLMDMAKRGPSAVAAASGAGGGGAAGTRAKLEIVRKEKQVGVAAPSLSASASTGAAAGGASVSVRRGSRENVSSRGSSRGSGGGGDKGASRTTPT